LSSLGIAAKKYSWLERGSDERQYWWPGITYPLITICRSKFGCFEEYHTSKDNLDFVKAEYLYESVDLFKRIISLIEGNKKYIANTVGEPQMGRRNLYPDISHHGTVNAFNAYLDVMMLCTGERDLIDLSDILEMDPFRVIEICNELRKFNLLTE
jgi:aminopeptidase-like protein